MRIGVQDPTGCGLGLALGFVDLGHDVAYDGPPHWSESAADDFGRMLGSLVRHTFGQASGTFEPDRCELLAVVDVFADFLGPMQPYLADDRRGLPAPPSLLLEYPARLERAIGALREDRPALVIDASDCRGPREVVFDNLPNVTLLARECPLGQTGPWRPWPFLYNNVLLCLERLGRRESWWREPGQRRHRVDWSFCGTLEHPRYGGRRARALDELRARWPDLRGEVHSELPFRVVLEQLRATRIGVDLPGAGELCFRLHEYLALGLPVWKPEPFTIATAAGLQQVMAADPEPLLELDIGAVRAAYDACYCPRVAAERALAAVGQDAGRGLSLRTAGARH